MDDEWTSLDRTITPGAGTMLQERFRLQDEQDPASAMRDPFRIAVLFLSALTLPPGDSVVEDALRLLVTPESRTGFGDFAAARARLAAIDQWAVGEVPRPATGDPEVTYVKVLSGVAESFRFESEQLVQASAVITLVWRSQVARWMVHDFGDYVPPQQVPKLSRRRHH